MKWNDSLGKVWTILKKYRYPAIVALLGLLLMLWPGGGGHTSGVSAGSAPAQAESFDLAALQKEIEELLEDCEGVGKTRVMLTQASSMETVYEKNKEQTTRNQSGGDSAQYESSEKADLVLTRDGSYAETPVVLRTDYPALKGAAVVCQGGNSSKVRLMVTDVVRSLTGISSENITVLKMKGE